jgi:ABC-type sugar transport system ATPase subunit/ribose/xylose/arabinose/galactoside ABC-type transport system permease subunit
MSRLAAALRGARSYGLAIVLALMCALFAVRAPGFATSGNLNDVLRNLSVIGIVALGEMFVLLGGGLDLSVGSVLLLAGILSDDLIRLVGMQPLLAIVIAVAAGTAAGVLNGVITTVLKVPPFIVTLAGLYAYRGIALSLYRTSASGANLQSTLINDQTFLFLGGGNVAGAPLGFLILIVLVVVATFMLRRTTFGAHLYALGGNELATRLSRIRVNRLTVQTYAISGTMAALAGVILASRVRTGAPQAGLGVEFDAIGAVVIGGASLFGGSGTALGTLLGAAFVTVLAKGQLLLGVAVNYQSLTKGLVILLAVLMDLFTRGLEPSVTVGRRATGAAEWSSGEDTAPLVSSPLLADGHGEPASGNGHRAAAPNQPATGPPILEVRDVSKSFADIQALDEVSLQLRPGEIHALVGENGAGKSTLIKAIAGVHRADSGELRFRGEPVSFAGVPDAQELGIATVYQERAVVPALSVADNILLGREPTGRLPGVIDHGALNASCRAILAHLGSPMEPTARAGSLSTAMQQLVDIARALSFDAPVVLLDEPTAALTSQEKDYLFGVMRQLRAQGKALLFISHALEEVFEIADRVTVLRDGKVIRHGMPVADATRPELVRLMIGREIDESAMRARPLQGEALLRVEGLSVGGVLEDVSFTLHAGEVLGIAGLVGAGRTELLRAIFGADRIERGKVSLRGRPLRLRSPRDGRRAGLGFVPEDRQRDGLVEVMSVGANLTLPSYDAITRLSAWIDPLRERGLAVRTIARLRIQPPRPRRLARHLSGGNQQKVVVGKWLARSPSVLLIDEPTQGVDVGAKEEIYRLLDELARSGVAILMVSSYLPEILRMSDRVLVMRSGRVVLELPRLDATEERLLTAATGGHG